MVDFSIEIDFTFIEQIIRCMDNPDEYPISELIKHEAAMGVHSHASRYWNTDKNLHDFWEDKIRLESSKGKGHIDQILSCMKYIDSNTDDFSEAFEEIKEYLPIDLRLSRKLFLIVGYDSGIVSDGNAYLNLGYTQFHKHKRELLYIAMHELHHVGYTHYNQTYSMEELKSTTDLLRIVRYATHLEGLAVYASLERRRMENGFTHRDYILLNDPARRERASSEFLNILKGLEDEPERVLVDEDRDILKLMSAGDRLWYVMGAHMAELIDEKLGRKTLNQTIIEGPDSFFHAYTRTMI